MVSTGMLARVPSRLLVAWIFGAYAADASPRAIAATLNSEGIAPPRGIHLNASTMNGNGKRGHTSGSLEWLARLIEA
jgi:hypothetical protein